MLAVRAASVVIVALVFGSFAGIVMAPFMPVVLAVLLK